MVNIKQNASNIGPSSGQAAMRFRRKAVKQELLMEHESSVFKTESDSQQNDTETQTITKSDGVVINAKKRAHETTSPYPSHSPLECTGEQVHRANKFNDAAAQLGPRPSDIIGAAINQLNQVISRAIPTELEKSVQDTVVTLGDISSLLNNVIDNPNARRCHKTIEDLVKSYKTERTVIGVVGDTGAGKSSLINALIGEEKVLPTNCMRACTAVPTEVSWNESELAEEQYRAEVEFITQEEWQTELSYLFDDLADGNGGFRTSKNKETDEGVAWAKIKAVYPWMDSEELANTDKKSLARRAPVSEMLGTTQLLKATSAHQFYKKVQQYINSKDDNATLRGGCGPSRLWPLIKVVRLYLKSEILSTGVVLVDLPGVGDSNAARASVADKYLENCNGIWIVAPIVRAVDNKTAQHLLGETFKMQLKFDGGFSAVSFICSQTDEISLREAAESLGFDQEYEELLASRDRQCGKDVKKPVETEDLEVMREEAENAKNLVNDKIGTWKALAKMHNEGREVYAPLPGSNKRKSTTQIPQPNKKRRLQRKVYLISDDEAEEEESIESRGSIPLTGDEINAMLAQLESERISNKEHRIDLDNQLASSDDDIATFQDNHETLERILLSRCIMQRNECSRTTIQDQFALGIEMLDQETAIKENAEDFDPSHKVRDYEQVARSLPVFCVSSRAYQAKRNPKTADGKFPGFEDLDQTEIPQLKQHAQKMTELGRIEVSTKFLNGCLRIFQSLNTWLEPKSMDVLMSETEATMEVEKVESYMAELKQELETAANKSVEDCQDIFNKKLYRSFNLAIINASATVAPIAAAWGAPTYEGGLHHNTYIATCRRGGFLTRKGKGQIDFNEDLVRPFKARVIDIWNATFSYDIPGALDRFYRIAKNAIEYFHEKIQSHVQHMATVERIELLRPQLVTYIEAVKNSQADFHTKVNEWQREANRKLTPGIRNAMAHAYLCCQSTSGQGCYARMKTIINEQVSERKKSMFEESASLTRKRLNLMCEDYGKELPKSIVDILHNMAFDYVGTIHSNTIVAAPETTRAGILSSLKRLHSNLPSVSVEHYEIHK